jgi:hypothetical protein
VFDVVCTNYVLSVCNYNLFIYFPCKGDESSFVRIKFYPTVHQPRMEKVSDFRSVQSVAELTVRKILISSANKYLEYLTELQRSLINK